jgi:DNA-binding NtrC family response regulator
LRPDLLLTDYFMPDISGAELIGHARELHPGLNVIVLTGHGEFVEQEPWMDDVRRLAVWSSTPSRGGCRRTRST